MTTYFEARTEDGNLTITDTTAIYHLKSIVPLSQIGKVHTGSIPFTLRGESNRSHTYYAYKIPEVNSDDMYFLHNPSNTSVLFWDNITELYRYDGNAKYYFCEAGTYIVLADCTEAIADACLLYTYTNKYEDDSDCGIVCYDGDGNIVFSSDSYQLKIQEYYYKQHTTKQDILFAGSDFKIDTFTKTSTNKIGVWFTSNGYGGASADGYAGEARCVTMKLSSNSYTITYFNNWDSEYNNVANKTYYFTPIVMQDQANTMFTVAKIQVQEL